MAAANFMYAKFCPVAAATTVMGDFWTPLIVRELLYGTDHFNQLVRNVPGISRSLLVTRLRALERAGIVEAVREHGQKVSNYRLTPAGRDLEPVIAALNDWGVRWGQPDGGMLDVDPMMAICMLKSRVLTGALPDTRVVVEVTMRGEYEATAWLVCERGGVSMCATPPGFETDLWVATDVKTAYEVWMQRVAVDMAVASGRITVEGRLPLSRRFPGWFPGTGGESATMPPLPAMARA